VLSRVMRHFILKNVQDRGRVLFYFIFLVLRIFLFPKTVRGVPYFSVPKW
jgi:hypothetical protein